MIRRSLCVMTLSGVMALALIGCAGAGPAAQTQPESGQAKQMPKEEAPMISGDWAKDVTLDVPFEGTQQLSAISGEDLAIPAGEAQAVRVFLDLKTEEAEEIDYDEGGVAAEYVLASLSGEDAEAYPEITGILDEYNRFAQERVGRELEEGKLRHTAYEASKEKPEWLFLTSWIGLETARSDSQIFSALTGVYRYNRGYEPDYYELHGVTIDTQTGRRLTLADFFTDTAALPEKIMESLELRRGNFASEEERQTYFDMISSSVEGCRDDGSFAWLVYPDGVEFRMVLKSTGEQERHTNLSVLVPFAACSDIVRADAAEVTYNYVYPCAYQLVKTAYGTDLPVEEEGSQYGSYYIVQKNGQKYLYKCHDERTDVYVKQGTARLVGSCRGEIVLPEMTCAGTMPDPAHFEMSYLAQLLQELFLRAEASVGEDGLPVLNGLFETTTNPTPMTTQTDFEAEIFTDEEAQESTPGTVPAYTTLVVIRSDGESFVDAVMDTDGQSVCRLIVGGNEEDGWTINGLPKNEVIGNEGWFEE